MLTGRLIVWHDELNGKLHIQNEHLIDTELLPISIDVADLISYGADDACKFVGQRIIGSLATLLSEFEKRNNLKK